MSRVGKQPITIPQGVEVELEDGVFVARGPRGEVRQPLVAGISAEIVGGEVVVTRRGDSSDQRARHGLMRALLANAVTGVAEGFRKRLEIHGVGYRAQLKGRELHLSLGFSHPVIFAVPEGIDVEFEERVNRLTISGADRQLVGQVAADIRALRKPEPYKGKGIRYSDEVVHRKVGKAGAK